MRVLNVNNSYIVEFGGLVREFETLDQALGFYSEKKIEKHPSGSIKYPKVRLWSRVLLLDE